MAGFFAPVPVFVFREGLISGRGFTAERGLLGTNKKQNTCIFLTVMHGLAAWQTHLLLYIQVGITRHTHDTILSQFEKEKRKKKKNTSLIIIIVIFNILWHAEFCNNIFAIYHPFQLQIISSKFNLSISVLCNSFFVFSALNVAIRQCLCCFIDTILPQKILRFDVVSNFSPPLLWACMHSILGPWLTHLLVALRVGYFLSPGQKKISEKNMLRQ